MSVDLHLHTTASDGSLSPGQVVELAANLGLNAIAISDHDTVEGINEALAFAEKLSTRVIPAVELSSRYNSRDMHILGFFIDYKSRILDEALRFLRKARVERAEKIVVCLQGEGLDITFDEVLEMAGGASVGRPHIARVLLKNNQISRISEAFIKYLKRGAPCYIDKFVYSPSQAISLIHEVGGVAVFAHPGLAGLDEHIPEFAAMGLDGIEAYHIEHAPDTVQHYLKIAKDHNLVVSGGSDCHGPLSTHGLRLGTAYVPDKVAGQLEERIKSSGL